MAATFLKYGYDWPVGTNPLKLEFEMIRMNYGQPGTVKHYLAMHKLLLPEDPQHRWFVQGLTAIVENKATILLGCANSAKTYLMSFHAIADFLVFPNTSLALISSTDIRSLELRIWGRGIKYLFNRMRKRFPWLPGFILESKMAIVPDDIDEEGQFAREIDKGLVCVPCVSGGKFVGMSKFQGVKPPNSPGKEDGILKSYNDELAVMQPSILDGAANFMGNLQFKLVGSANPTDISDPACIAAEPVGGWDAFVDNGKTQTWRSRWHDAFVLAFDGRDTPNNDEPRNQFPFLARSGFVDELIRTYGADSWQVYQQGIGKPSRGMVSNRVITIGLCEKNKAFDSAIFKDGSFIDIAGLDLAFGGGDRCVWIQVRIGVGLDGIQILEFQEPEVVPIRVNYSMEPEAQIAEFVFNKSQSFNLQPQNIFYDSFGRGTMGHAFAARFGGSCPVPVDSGARPTARPVRFDLFVDERDGSRRLKRCDEHYSKFVSEAWFSMREAIESGQIRSLPRSVAEEGQLRLFSVVSGNRIEVEPKDEMNKRIRKSPDLMDAACIAVEGARQRNFKIKRIGSAVEVKRKPDWLDNWQKELGELHKSRQLENA